MSQHVIDFRTNADTGEVDSAAIAPIADGEPANQTNLRRPTENTRYRNEVMRKLVRQHVVLNDLDRTSPGLSGGGTVTFNGAYLTYAGTFTLGADLHVLPFATAGDDAVASPYVASTTAKRSVGTPATNEIVFTSVKKQFQGATFPHADANKISVEIVHTGSLSVTVGGATGEEDNILITINSGTTTCDDVITAVNTDVTANLLVSAALGVGSTGTNACPLWGAAEWGSDYAQRFLIGGMAGVSHKITAAALTSFFGAATANLLRKGDTLAIWYDKLIEEGGTGGRFQSTIENANQSIPAGSLFNSRREPEKIPNCIPICKCVDDDTLLFVNGAIIKRGTPASLWFDSVALLSGELALLATPLGWARMDTGTVHNPPVTVRQALDNADGHLDAILTEIEAARVQDDLQPSGSPYLDLDDRMDRAAAVASLARTTLTVSAFPYEDLQYLDASGLVDAITALNALNGGTIILRQGDYTVTGAIVPPIITKPIRIVGVGTVRIKNDRGLGADNYLFRFEAGSEGSSLENLTIGTEVTAPSNKGIRVDANNVYVKNCNIIGYTRIRGWRVRFEQCYFEDGTNAGGSETSIVEFTGIGANAARNSGLYNCRVKMVVGGRSLGYAIRMDPSTSEALDDQTDGCILRDVHIDSRNGDGALYIGNQFPFVENVTFTCRPYTAATSVMRCTNCGGTYRKLQFRLASWSGNSILGNLIKVDSSFNPRFDDVDIDTQQAYLGAYAAGDQPLYFSGYGVLITNLRYFGILLPDSVAQGATLDYTRPIILLHGETAGGAGGMCTLKDSRIYAMFADPAASGNVHYTIIGDATHNDTSGIMVLDNVEMDGSLFTYTGGTYFRFGVRQMQEGSIIRNCHFHDGIFSAVIYIDEHEISVLNNRFDYQNFTYQIQSIIRAEGYVNSRGRGLKIIGNSALHADTLSVVMDFNGASVYFMRDGQFNNNNIRNVENNTPQQAVRLDTTENWTCIGNMVYTTAARIGYNNVLNMVPTSPNLGTLNALN